MSVEQLLEELPLVDHHCHGVVRGDLDRAGLENLLTESDWPAPPGTTVFDTQLGFAVRRFCAPLLDLEPHSSPEDYLDRRTELGVAEVNRRLLAATGIAEYLVETGYRGVDILTPAEMAAVTGRPVHTVVRLEAVAEQVARHGSRPATFATDYEAALAKATVDAVGLKSIMAYRFGLDFDPQRPTPGEVVDAAARWLHRCEQAGRVRLDEPTLLRHVLWAGVDRRLPIQFHVGYGDADIELHRCNPLHLTRWLRAVQRLGVDVLLLHNYPYQREAGYLAHVYPHVYCDVGLAVSYTGSRSAEVIAESLELTPFHKALFSTDAFGLPELYLVGAVLFRRGLARALDAWVADGDWAQADAERVTRAVGYGNARRVYSLSES
jgi:uncharacterized protein